MRALISTICGLAAGGLLAMSAQAAMAGNVLPTGVGSATTTGVFGVASAGSPWGQPPSANVSTVYDGNFLPENQQWNIGSVWWDANVPGGDPASITLNLKHSYSLNEFIVQADNNDTYLLQYWNEGTHEWDNAFAVPTVCTDTSCFGLTTRDSGVLGSITTDALRFTAPDTNQPGDGYFSVSEIQAFGVEVPEPATWAMMLIGVAAIGAGMRMQRKGALAIV
jgi:PEP-CTERM motif